MNQETDHQATAEPLTPQEILNAWASLQLPSFEDFHEQLKRTYTKKAISKIYRTLSLGIGAFTEDRCSELGNFLYRKGCLRKSAQLTVNECFYACLKGSCLEVVVGYFLHALWQEFETNKSLRDCAILDVQILIFIILDPIHGVYLPTADSFLRQTLKYFLEKKIEVEFYSPWGLDV